MEVAAASDPLLTRFLGEYWRPDTFLDWGDDPAFFSAREHLGDSSRASWAVCRPDVRRAIREGDAIVFFNGVPETQEVNGRRVGTGNADYFYIGCGTVARRVDRRELWSDPSLLAYTTFYNALARPTADGGLENVEVFPPHVDWEKRAAAPVILFDPMHTRFNIETALHVSHYDQRLGPPDVWASNARSRRLEHLLFGSVRRRLRTSTTGYQHAKGVLRLDSDVFGRTRDELITLMGPHSSGSRSHS
jgi:hypothetical protein